MYPESTVKTLYTRFQKKEIKYVVIQNTCGTTALFDISKVVVRNDLFKRLRDNNSFGIRGWRGTNTKTEAMIWTVEYQHPPYALTTMPSTPPSDKHENHAKDGNSLKLGKSNKIPATVEHVDQSKCLDGKDEVDELLGKNFTILPIWFLVILVTLFFFQNTQTINTFLQICFLSKIVKNRSCEYERHLWNGGNV